MTPPKIQATALLRNQVMLRVERGFMFRVCLIGFFAAARAP